ncbi:MAG: trehalose-6-phosphate synthase, partial [Gemmatimonadota bacterium]
MLVHDMDGDEHTADSGLLIASNRLPIQLRRDDDGQWRREASSGGLVTALEPVLRRRGGVWVGWPGVMEGQIEEEELRALLQAEAVAGYDVEPVPLTRSERRDFYRGFSNEILWPLCHGLQSRCNFEPRYWRTYRRVNSKFARAIQRVAGPETFLWIHDYHLMAVAEELRGRGCENPAGFFLHIPFPPPDIFEQLPWATEVLKSLLQFDLVGFQTARDRENFLDCVEGLEGATHVVEEDRVETERGTTRVGAFPISIDNDLFRDGAMTSEVRAAADNLRADIGTERIILGVDRLDYTKGIPQKLHGLERALEKYPDLRGRVSLVQLVVPSRERIPEYHRMKKEIERLVGRINGEFTTGGWAPILYQFGTWEQTELLSFYRAADVALVTSIRDGMNLVSKEFCAASVDGRGVLVLSAFAGSADELAEHALTVNPNDVEAVADAIYEACMMEEAEQRSRLMALQRTVHDRDVHWWVSEFLGAAARTVREASAPAVPPAADDDDPDPSGAARPVASHRSSAVRRAER